MLNVYIINIGGEQSKIDNIIENINDQDNLNLMKVKALHSDKKTKNKLLECMTNVSKAFCPTHGITHLKLIENIYYNDNNNFSLIFEDNIVPFSIDLYDKINNIIDNCPKNWDMIKLIGNTDNEYRIEKRNLFEKVDEKNKTNAYIINKTGQKKILEYNFLNDTSGNIFNLNIYKSPINIFDINDNLTKKEWKLVKNMSKKIDKHFSDILMVLIITVTIGTVIYYVVKTK